MKNHETFVRHSKLRPEQLKAVNERLSVRAVAVNNVLAAAARTFPNIELSEEQNNQLRTQLRQDEKVVTDLISDPSNTLSNVHDEHEQVTAIAAQENPPAASTEVTNLTDWREDRYQYSDTGAQYATPEPIIQEPSVTTSQTSEIDDRMKSAEEARARVAQAHRQQPGSVFTPQPRTPQAYVERRAA